PKQIGRYEVIRLIASGGMGEVFEGYDRQLQRKVAIKGVLHDRLSAAHRERLRREALSSAALSHPAVVHVYEILTEGDADWVVMEYVSGSSLADILRAGPLSAREIARIGREIALALAEAHREGIIHRDIKTDNVMLTSAGHVKVLDFGLAMWTGPRGSDSDRITMDGLVVGTSRAMSPEQALGRDLDARSDVFSLGSMLYELAAGKPAFAGATVLETMHRVARVDCVPLAEAAPQLPADLRGIIERCMARDPGERYASAEALATDLQRLASDATQTTSPRVRLGTSQVLVRARRYWWVGAAALAVVTAIVAGAVKLGWISMRRPLTVAVLPIASTTSGEVARLASTAIEDAIISRLAQLENVIVVSGLDVRAVATAGKRVPAIARELGVRELLEASLTTGGADAQARVNLERLDGVTARVTWSEQIEVGTDDLMLLQDRITTALADAYRGIPTTGHPAAQDATPAALKAYLEARSRLDAGKTSKDFVEEIALLNQAIAQAPRFLGPLTRLAWIYRYLADTYRRPEDFTKCEELLKRANELSPGHPWVRMQEVFLAFDRAEYQKALEIARGWAAARPGDSLAWRSLAAALGRVGRFDQAEAAFTRSLALLPSSFTLVDLARAREDHGAFAGARQAIARALESSPGNLVALATLADIEMYAGNNAAAERLFRDLLARRGERLDRIHLGNCLYYQDRFAEAAALYREAWEKDRTDYLALANLADTQLAMGEKVIAGASYADALRLCDADYGQWVRRRALLETRARCLAQLGRGPEATLAIQEALREYPENPNTIFMAALVAAVSGDTNACLAWTEKARSLNAPAVFFQGPEFSSMRANPRFTSLLVAR
ncbi:MAG: protein kinase, partial [Thermoanaerobaculales bacterium]